MADSAIFAWRDAQDVDFTRFPLKEMVKRGWFAATGPNLAAAARDYFLKFAGPQFVTAYHRKKVRAENAPNEHALLAWQARILELAHHGFGKQADAEFEALRQATRSADPQFHAGPIQARQRSHMPQP